ncbi:MAG: response regulator [Thermoplasmata archaeon]|jgi:two-component system chemotaxis response regulator CheY|nr:response regulator [Thermoplasmata archaeon]
MTSVLIVDDEMFIVELYRDILQLRGYKVVGTAFDGEEALRKYSQSSDKPDVIIMDHRMPVMNGVDATREIVRMNPRQKVIFVSADVMVEKEAREAGAIDFLPKPFRMDDLIEKMERLSAK